MRTASAVAWSYVSATHPLHTKKKKEIKIHQYWSYMSATQRKKKRKKYIDIGPIRPQRIP
jgi:hypothetical protein